VTVKTLTTLLAAWGLVGSCAAEDLPVLRQAAEPFTFAVLGDLHYTPPEYKVASFVRRVAAEIRAAVPAVDLVCQTGDVVEGGCYQTAADGKRKFLLANYDEMRSQCAFVARELTAAFQRPLFIAVGNHDKHDRGARAYREILLPMLARTLGQPLSETYYAFRYGNACFVFLDAAPTNDAEQARFLERTLAAAARAGVRHAFLFAHAPLWSVVRPAFSRPQFTDAVLPVLRQHPVDAFFCGHTHNTVVCVRDLPGLRLTQIQGITNIAEAGKTLLPLEASNALLFPPAETPYWWGYREGSPTGYYLVRVAGPRVTVAWHVPGQGVVREFYWEQPGTLVDLKRPAPAPCSPLTPAQLRNARAATLVLAPWAESRVPVTLLLNGAAVAEAQLGPSYGLFWKEQRLALPRAKLGRLQPVNQFQVTNPTGAVFGVASVRLEVVLADGTQVATAPSSTFCFSCPQPQKPTAIERRAWQAATPDHVREAPLGQPLGPIELRFPGN
jgi:3',5'-cyclic AMP phosphodiesterase CpdA